MEIVGQDQPQSQQYILEANNQPKIESGSRLSSFDLILNCALQDGLLVYKRKFFMAIFYTSTEMVSCIINCNGSGSNKAKKFDCNWCCTSLAVLLLLDIFFLIIYFILNVGIGIVYVVFFH